MKRPNAIILTAFLSFILCNCASNPLPKEEISKVKNTYNNLILNNEELAYDNKNLKWNEFFLSNELKQIIKISLEQNKDLNIAVLNIEKANNNLMLAQNALKPNLKLNLFGGGTLKANGDTNGNFGTNIGLNNYEIDFFDRLKSLNEQARQEFLNQKYNQSAIKTALIYEIAKTYQTILSDEKQIQILNQNIISLNESLEIIIARQKSGFANDLETNSIKAQIHELNASLLSLKTKLKSDKTQLNLLMGNDIPAEFIFEFKDYNFNIAKIPQNIPSISILNRPEIRALEAQLKAQNANIDAVHAQTLPQINITSSLGFSSNSLLKLFDGGVFNFTPNIVVPIYDNGNSKINIDNAIINRDIVLQKYEKSIQNSFYDLANILESYSQIDERIKEQELAIKALQTSNFIAKERFKIGIDNYLPLLLSNRQLNNAQLNLIALYDLKNLYFLQFYKTLGIE